MDLTIFDDITTALQGETVIAIPRVSREVSMERAMYVLCA